MIDVETSIEPPPFGAPPFGEESDVDVSIWITETDGTRRMASVTVGDPDDERLADTLIACLRGCAAMRGPGLVAALESRLR